MFEKRLGFCCCRLNFFKINTTFRYRINHFLRGTQRRDDSWFFLFTTKNTKRKEKEKKRHAQIMFDFCKNERKLTLVKITCILKCWFSICFCKNQKAFLCVFSSVNDKSATLFIYYFLWNKRYEKSRITSFFFFLRQGFIYSPIYLLVKVFVKNQNTFFYVFYYFFAKTRLTKYIWN